MVYNVDATWANAPDELSDPLYDAADLRRADVAMFAGNGTTSLGTPGGIVHQGASTLAVTVDAADQVTIQPGAVVIPADAVSGAGCYRTALPQAHSEQLQARDSTNPRVDLVVFRMLDTDVVGTHPLRRAQLEVIAGDPSATPSAPGKPSMAIEVARLPVPAEAGGAATVDTSWRTYACAIGGELLVATAARLPATATLWQRARTLDTGEVFEWDGSDWTGDSGWVALPLKGGFTGPLSVRRKVCGCIKFKGTASGSYPTGALVDGLVPAGGIPEDMRPTERAQAQLSGNAAASDVRAYVDTDGSISVVTGPTAPAYVAVNGLSGIYETD